MTPSCRANSIYCGLNLVDTATPPHFLWRRGPGDEVVFISEEICSGLQNRPSYHGSFDFFESTMLQENRIQMTWNSLKKLNWKAKFYLKLHLPPHSGSKEQIKLYTKEDAIDVKSDSCILVKGKWLSWVTNFLDFLVNWLELVTNRCF